MGWFSDMFNGRTEDTPKQGFFESDADYRSRMHREANERLIEDTTGSEPRQGFFESDNDYDTRVRKEANEQVIESSTGEKPRQGFFESDYDYRSRIDQEANERVIESASGSKPSQGFFESDSNYRHRVENESNEHTIEAATGSSPRQGFFESDDHYQDRIREEAEEYRASSNDESASNGCFITSACVEFAGLPDDCYELTVLRSFRDNYIAHLPNGQMLISDYYERAPRILKHIRVSPYRSEILASTFNTIHKAIAEIEKREPALALETYRALLIKLEQDHGEVETKTAASS